MDPQTLAATAVTALAPYLAKAGEKAVEEVGKKLPGFVGTMWQALIGKFTGKPAAEEAARDLVATPDDADTQGAFRKELRKLLDAEPAFAEELARLLAQAQEAGGGTVVNTGAGAVATHGGVAGGAGGVAVGRDVHGGITLGRSEKQG